MRASVAAQEVLRSKNQRDKAMILKSSHMAEAVEPSLSRHLFNLAKQYDDVIDLTLGDPDLVPNQMVRDGACAGIQLGNTRYSANAGLPELREVIADCVSSEYRMPVDPTSDVIVTVGGMEALFLGLAATVDPGDEVIVFAPYYVNYIQMIRMCGAVPKLVWTLPEEGFSWSREQLESQLSERTVAIIVNSPCNPTGRVFTSGELDVIAQVAKERDLLVISDEVYKTLVFDGRTHDSILLRDGMSERTLLVDSVSKRFSMTGYRLGFAVGPKDIITNMTKMQENVAACAPLPSQHAALVAYSECASDTWIQEEFEKRRNVLCDGLAGLSGISFIRPDATFYLWADISGTGLSCMDFAYQLLESQHVAVVPGVTYGERYDEYVRIAFTHRAEVLVDAVRRITSFVNSL